MSLMTLHERFKNIFGDTKQILIPKKYFEVNAIIETPNVPHNQVSNLFSITYPYMLQKIKMWGCHALYAQQFYSLLHTPDDLSINEIIKQSNCAGNIPIARIDFITFLIGTSDCLVASDIIKTISKFPMAMPLVVCDLQTDRYVLLLPLYNDVTIKWIGSSGKIVENYLFRSPFKIVVCVRVGDSGKQSGKSVILNHVMKKKNFFSTRGEPGGRHGKPCTVDGSVEFCWLTEETSDDPLWSEVLKPHYAKETNALILLANLHGDVSNFSDVLKVFESFSPTYLVFVMKSAQIKSEWPDSIKNSLLIYVDPEDEHSDEPFTIDTSMLYDYHNIKNLTKAISRQIGNQNEKMDTRVENFTFTQSLIPAEKIYTAESQVVINFVRKNTCRDSKIFLKSSPELMSKFMEIFNLSPPEIRKAMTHLEYELSYQSIIESLNHREIIQQLKNDRRSLVGSEALNSVQISELNTHINEAMEEVDSINFGLEHFFRDASNSFQSENTYHTLPSYCADLLLNGSAIELLNGDDQQLSIEWIKEICLCINKQMKDMKVFVLSIIGLQSSGKSTLLNALFSCKFAVSVGRCSRGLFMRLAFLHENLRSDLGFDAFLLIDTEGLDSPEKLNDDTASQKDRRMATLAMGISDLTIINVMGESITEMTEILQIAMIAMTRLGKSDMASDILLVQHLQEKNAILSSGGKDSFCKALEMAFNVIRKYAVAIGAVDSECLHNMVRRIQGENSLKQFNPLKDGSTVYAAPSEGYHQDVVDLYKTIISVTKEVANKQTLVDWCNLVGSYWTCAKNENFVSTFKNVKKVIEFIKYEKKMEKVKNAIVDAYSSHGKMLTMQMTLQITEKKYDKNTFLSKIEAGLTNLSTQCSAVTENQLNCELCTKMSQLINQVTHDVEMTDKKLETAKVINDYFEKTKSKSLQKLSRMFDAAVFQNNFCDRYEKTINAELKLILDSKEKDESFTEKQREEEVTAIWKKLEDMATEGKVEEPVQTKIVSSIKNAYKNNQQIVNIYLSKDQIGSFEESEKDKGRIARLRNYLASLSHSKDTNTSLLPDKLNQLVHNILGDDSSFQGFDPRMINQLQADIEQILSEFQKDLGQKLDIKKHWQAHAYALQKFAADIVPMQEKWDLKHDPQVILKNKKKHYTDKINNRLLLRFTARGDGDEVAQTLYTAMCKQAKSHVEQQLNEDFKKIDWVKHAESIRLKYFEGLANEVLGNNKGRAVDHFMQPKSEIESWFFKMSDSYEKKITKERYISYLKQSKRTIESWLTEGDVDNAVLCMKNYIAEASEIYSLDHSNYTDEEKSQFMETVIKAVRNFDCNKELLEPLALPSADSDVVDRLGCTHHCPVCHALCWLSRGHENQTKSSHWTCHQPVGLGLCRDYDTKELMCQSCDEYKDSDTWYLDDKKMKWSSVKEHYPNWSFDNYFKDTFEVPMKWFMEMLHTDLARSATQKYENCNCKPASPSNLKKNGCVGIEIIGVLQNIRSLVGH